MQVNVRVHDMHTRVPLHHYDQGYRLIQKDKGSKKENEKKKKEHSSVSKLTIKVCKSVQEDGKVCG